MEVGILTEMYPTNTLAEIAKRINRTETAIQVRACRMGLHKLQHPRYHYWTPQMLKLLTTYFPTMFNKPLAKWIGVSLRTMLRKARELGLEKQEGFLDKRRKEINRMAGEALKKVDNPARFKKGERFCPEYEFKKGHRESQETKEKRIAAMREAWRRKKAAQIKYY
jgi:hypothetical protein